MPKENFCCKREGEAEKENEREREREGVSLTYNRFFLILTNGTMEFKKESKEEGVGRERGGG